MPYNISTRTALNVITQIRRTFGDEAAVQVADTDIFQWINDAQQEIINRTKVLKAKSTVASTIGQSDYTFPNLNIVDVDALHYKGVLLRNIPFSEAEQIYIGQTSSAGDQPTVWWEYAGTFTLWPTPPDVQNIDVFATVYPPRIAAPTDLLGLPDKFYRQIIQYVLQQVYELDEDLELSQLKGTQFTQGLADFSEEERTAAKMTFETVTLVDWDT